MLSAQVRRAKRDIAFLAEGPFPIDLVGLANRHGIESIQEKDFRAIDAMLTKTGSLFSIVVNSNHLPTRKRFSIAHEIGHVLIAEQQSEVQFRRPTCGGTALDPVERACNQLAAEILMPEEPFKKNAASYEWGIKGAVALSEIFATSLESTLRRCIELASAPMALVKWKLDPSLRPRHMYTPKTLRTSLRIMGFDRQKYLADVLALSQAYTHEGIWKGAVPFEVLSHRNALPMTRSFLTESMGIGRGDTRRVFSLVRLSEQPPREEPTP